jgi:hypothetical protein
MVAANVPGYNLYRDHAFSVRSRLRLADGGMPWMEKEGERNSEKTVSILELAEQELTMNLDVSDFYRVRSGDVFVRKSTAISRAAFANVPQQCSAEHFPISWGLGSIIANEALTYEMLSENMSSKSRKPAS